MNQKHRKIQQMATIAVMTAVLCVMGPVTIPIGVVPVSFLPLILYITIYILGTINTVKSCILYIGIGFIGLPVFAGYTGGPAVLLGPTGGYIWGYLFLVLLSGIFIRRFQRRVVHFLGMMVGLFVCYLVGSLFLMFSLDVTFIGALSIGVMPFVAFDILKITAAVMLGPMFYRYLKKANVIS